MTRSCATTSATRPTRFAASAARRWPKFTEWEQLRTAAARIKDEVLNNLDVHLLALEKSVTAAGGHVHWARDAAEACAIVSRLVKATGATEAIKMKSLTTDEIGLNDALGKVGVTAWETDLAEMIVQFGRR